jgi:DNA-binding NarL/FixJ family response regulator
MRSRSWASRSTAMCCSMLFTQRSSRRKEQGGDVVLWICIRTDALSLKSLTGLALMRCELDVVKNNTNNTLEINVPTTNRIADDHRGSSAFVRKPYTVLIADDYPIVREGLAMLINRRSDMQVIAEASDGREAVEKYVALSPDVVLLELKLPLMDGIETVMSICAKAPAARLVVFTMCQGEEDIYRALRAGAYGYLFKNTSLNELVECILAVAQGNRWIPPAVAARLGKRVADRGLTTRETQVLRAVTSGKSNKEIGGALDISESTVKVHMTHILEKLNVAGRTEAINVAMRRGLVHMDPAEAA